MLKKIKNFLGKNNIKFFLFICFLNGWLLYAKFRNSILDYIIIPLTLIIFIVLMVRGVILLLQDFCVIDLLPRLLPIFIFFGISSISPYDISYIEYKIRLADFQQDIASKEIKSGTQYFTWDKWNKWDSDMEDFDFFIYSNKVLSEKYEISPHFGSCVGRAKRLEGNFYIFFSKCV